MTDNELEEKMCMNSLLGERMARFSADQKKEIVDRLLKITKKSERRIAEELGIPHTTLHGWKTGKEKDRSGEYVNLNLIIRKMESFEISHPNDRAKLEKIMTLIKGILEKGD